MNFQPSLTYALIFYLSKLF